MQTKTQSLTRILLLCGAIAGPCTEGALVGFLLPGERRTYPAALFRWHQ